MRTSLFLATLALVAAAAAQAAPPDLKLGKATFARCAGCHAMNYDLAGPRLCELFGRRAGSMPGFAYSDAMKQSHIVWSAKTLDRFLADHPKMPGATSSTGAVTDRAARAALIAYLQAANQGAECHGPR